MYTSALGDVIADKFRLPEPPTLLARPLSNTPVSFSQLRTEQSGHGRTRGEQPEDAFVFHVMLAPLEADVWKDGKHKTAVRAMPGDAFLFDMAQSPAISLNTPFDMIRFYISKNSLDEMAREKSIAPTGGLSTRTPFGSRDAVMHGLAQTLAASMDQPGEGSKLFGEHIALAFHQHVVQSYGNIVPVGRGARGGLAPWQLRRANDFIEGNLDGDPSIARLADECGLSISHFARAFKQTVGMPPHQWLTKRRVDRARDLLLG